MTTCNTATTLSVSASSTASFLTSSPQPTMAGALINTLKTNMSGKVKLMKSDEETKKLRNIG